ncbi:ion channel TACAN-like [Coregonus clupeaformis]|uniref:ion channel TACAN-like n=1 Tax=Coregonus clupeaformis TaxID=59861 RepID=UPI001E1C46C0|nr:ion channel TACAN-like [Coregonus clupeaformis]
MRLSETHRLYKQKLEEVSKLQDSCSHAIARQRNKLKELIVSLGDWLYLSLVLGIVNVTLLNKHSKFTYKDEYEKFKLVLTVLLLFFSFTCRFVFSYRALDAHFNFLLVWYYCTLTIRESILISNGSRINGWWVFHHYVFCFLYGVMLTYPEGILYQMFRNQFLAYCLYQSFVQFLQYYYQSGCLYRLRALGESHNMDLPVGEREVTHCCFWQLYNVLTLFRMAQLPECRKWQVFMCGCSYLVLFMGNFSTTLGVVYHKYIHNIEKDNWTLCK